jgi:hypothetical protein
MRSQGQFCASSAPTKTTELTAHTYTFCSQFLEKADEALMVPEQSAII